MEKYTDSHAHYSSSYFSKDRNDLLNTLLKNDVNYIFECGTNTKFNKAAINLANTYDNIYAVIGFFPTDVKELENKDTLDAFIKQLELPKVIGLGEIGLDYHHKADKNLQKKWFIEQLKIAKEKNIPVWIHSREAEIDTINILKNNGKYKGVIHCFSYGITAMKILDNLGYYFGIGGTSTYKNNSETRTAIKQMPIEKIILETDAPYLTPEAAGRKNRNDSSNIKYVIQELAKLKKIPPDEIVKISNNNIKKIVNL